MKVDRPIRATRSRSFRVAGAAETVFPLFCPVRETEWIESWDPANVYSVSGIAERGCVFTTSDENGPSTWIITEHDVRSRAIALIKFTPEFTVCELAISVMILVERLIRRLKLDEAEKQEVLQWLESPPPLESVDPDLVPREHRMKFLAAIESIITVDGEVSPEERESLIVFAQLIQ